MLNEEDKQTIRQQIEFEEAIRRDIRGDKKRSRLATFLNSPLFVVIVSAGVINGTIQLWQWRTVSWEAKVSIKQRSARLLDEIYGRMYAGYVLMQKSNNLDSMQVSWDRFVKSSDGTYRLSIYREYESEGLDALLSDFVRLIGQLGISKQRCAVREKSLISVTPTYEEVLSDLRVWFLIQKDTPWLGDLPPIRDTAFMPEKKAVMKLLEQFLADLEEIAVGMDPQSMVIIR